MFSEYAIEHKVKIAVLLAIVLVLVITNNLLERRNLNSLEQSFSQVYQDRLMAESYIFNIAEQINKKEHLTDLAELNQNNLHLKNQLEGLNAQILNYIEKFKLTKLTNEEAVYFNQFLIANQNIINSEYQLLQKLKVANTYQDLNKNLDSHYKNANVLLAKLSDIQVIEGTKINETSQRLMSGSFMASTFEISLLIIIALIIQLMIFASKSMVPKIPQNHHLN